VRIRWLSLAVPALVALALAGCGSDTYEVTATFDDVADLTTNGAVKIADVRAGRVADVELTDQHRARVTLELDGEHAIPDAVTARLRKTNVLGERYVELVPHQEEATGELAHGDEIPRTVIVPELEEAILTGTEIVAAVAADAVAGSIEAGAQGLGGRGETLGGVIDDVGRSVSAYDDASEDLVRLVEGLEGFVGEAGPRADLHGRALAESARFFEVLEEEDDRLVDALSEARSLARTGTDILREHRQRMDDGLRRLDAVGDEVVAQRADLDRLWTEVHSHNLHTFPGINAEFAQILLDLAVCGVNTTPGDAVRGCQDSPQARERPQPRPRQDF
jgi:phospholipid/cholesterol/gamma-HCH transport system substrate-binding protein